MRRSGRRRRRRSQARPWPVGGRRRGRGGRRRYWLTGLRCLLLFEEVDDEVLVFADEVVGQAFGLQILSEMLPPLGVKGIQLFEPRRR